MVNSTRPKFTITRPETLINGDDRTFREVIHAIQVYAGQIQEVRNRLATQLGLSGSQYTVLSAIHTRQGAIGVSITDIAEYLHLSGAFITIEVNRLVAARLVTKVADRDDRRRVRVSLTAAAKRQLEELRIIQAPINDALFADLSEPQFRALAQTMQRLVINGDHAIALADFLDSQATRTLVK